MTTAEHGALSQEVHDNQEDLDNNYVVVLVAKGGARLKPDEGIKITGFNTDAGPATVGLATRFQEIGLANRLPQDVRGPLPGEQPR
jgi:hypothetical protein